MCAFSLYTRTVKFSYRTVNTYPDKFLKVSYISTLISMCDGIHLSTICKHCAHYLSVGFQSYLILGFYMLGLYIVEWKEMIMVNL
jgi:hypothetical protein